MQFHSFARRRNEITPRAIRKDNKETQTNRTALSHAVFLRFKSGVHRSCCCRWQRQRDAQTEWRSPARQAIGDRRRIRSQSTESASLLAHSTAAICLPRIPSGRAGNGAGGRSQWRPRDFRKMSGTQDYIQLDLLGLIAASFTNVKFQMGSYALLLAGMLGLAGVSFARRLATQKA